MDLNLSLFLILFRINASQLFSLPFQHLTCRMPTPGSTVVILPHLNGSSVIIPDTYLHLDAWSSDLPTNTTPEIQPVIIPDTNLHLDA